MPYSLKENAMSSVKEFRQPVEVQQALAARALAAKVATLLSDADSKAVLRPAAPLSTELAGKAMSLLALADK
jgi:hypothetical protein